MDLNLDIRTKGRAARPVSAEVERELCLSDIALLATEKGVKPPPLAKIRASHHELARAIAEGLKPYEVAIRTGYSLSRVSILSQDPAILDLVAVYSEARQREFIDSAKRMALLHNDAVEILHERLLDDPGEWDNKEITELVMKTADRSGLAPQTKSVTVNINQGLGERLLKARSKSGIIEGELVALPSNEESVP